MSCVSGIALCTCNEKYWISPLIVKSLAHMNDNDINTAIIVCVHCMFTIDKWCFCIVHCVFNVVPKLKVIMVIV